MPKLLIAMATMLLIVMACTGRTVGEGSSGLRYTHDAHHQVSCWTYGDAIACLPDNQVAHPGHSQPAR